jgi:hypothetical protein
MVRKRHRTGPVIGWALALLGAACGLGLGGTGQQQDDADGGAAQTSSSSGSSSGVCPPAGTQSCACPGGGTGTATCSAGGQAFVTCDGCPTHGEAGPHDSGSGGGSKSDATITDSGAAADAGVCNACIEKSCPGAAAACGPGTDCQALLLCELACTNSDANGCSNDCTAMHPSGSTAFATYTLCALACGAGCLAAAANGSDDGGSDDSSDEASDASAD